MRTIIIITAFFAASLAAYAQLATTFIISSNDVVQSSIMFGHPGTGTNDTRVGVKFAFTETGAKRLEGFYRAHKVGDEVYWQCGSFVHPFKLDDRKIFGREGFWGLSETDGKALLAGLRGQP
jgi:hypothetical protein